MAVQCVICHLSFKKRDALRQHFIDDHSVPEGDEILNRYLELRFSSKTSDWQRKQSMLVRLAKLLKTRAVRYTLNREKVKLKISKAEKLLNEYNYLDDVVVESVSSVESDVENYTKMAAVKWFLKYYDVFVNKSVSMEDRMDLIKLFSADEGTFTHCTRLKIEQKHDVNLDFRVNVPKAREGISPSESFTNIQKVL